MKQFTRKSISVLLSLLMALSVFAGLAFTVGAADVVESGSCGSGTSYTIDSDGLLTITGSGFITNQSFRDKGTFTDVMIEDGITGIGGGAFLCCPNLTTLTVGNGVTSIGSQAFRGCSSLTTVKLGNSVTTLEFLSFAYCNSLTSVILPSSITSLDSGAFSGCNGLKNVYYKGSEEQGTAINISAAFPNATIHYNYREVGDLVEFGTYPQTKVTDSTLVSALDAADKTWMSYNYYSGTYPGGNSNCSYDGLQQPGDWMRYADFFYGGEKYRAVTFELYRPRWLDWAAETTGSVYNDIYSNGYLKNQVYYFKYEPLIWQVLDPETGFVLCRNVVDSQSFCNTPYYERPYYYKGIDSNVKACIYETSDLRIWLNDEFYLTAFSESQKANIKTAAADAVNDKVLLLTKTEANNADYGLTNDSRVTTGTDYAKAQGLYKDNNSVNAIWSLRTWSPYNNIDCVEANGEINKAASPAKGTFYGIRPACYLEMFTNSVAPSELLLSEHLSEGHTYGDPTWTWADDHSSADAVFTCSVCGKTVTLTDSEPAPTTVSEQDCTTAYVVKYTATVELDGETYSDTTENVTLANATGHHYTGEPVWGEWADDNTVVATFKCDDCTNTITPEVTVTPVTTDPTCTEAGYTVYTAKVTNNGTEYTNPTTKTVDGDPATGHTYGEPTWVWAEGYGSATATFACACGDEQPVTDAAPETVEISAVDCENDQVVKYTAKVTFNELEYSTETEEITVEDSALGHLWSWVIDQDSTCTETGLKYEKCARCNATQSAGTVVPTKPHDLKSIAAIAPTCKAEGRIACWKCRDCDKYFSDELGTTEISEEDIIVAKLPHDLVAVTAVEAGCADGNIAYWYCAVCKKVFSDAAGETEISPNETVIPALGHSFRVSTTDATCTETGKTTYTCTRCGYSYEETIEKKPHTDADGNGYCDACGRSTNPDVCLLCGNTHTGTFGKIIQVIHHIIWVILHWFD